MKPVGTVSARSQTTMKRARKSTRLSSRRNSSEADLPNSLIEQEQEEKTQPPPQRRKRRRVFQDIKEEEEEESSSSDGTYGEDAPSPRSLKTSKAENGGKKGFYSSSSVDYEGSSDDNTKTPVSNLITTNDQNGSNGGNKGKDAFKCPFCDHRSGRPNNLVIHINSKHYEETPPRTCSQDPAECIGESILYFLTTKKEFEEKITNYEAQLALSNKTLSEVLEELTPEQKDNLRKKAERSQNRFLTNMLG